MTIYMYTKFQNLIPSESALKWHDRQTDKQMVTYEYLYTVYYRQCYG